MSVRRHNQKLLTDKPPTRALTRGVKIIKHRLAGLGHGASEPVHLEGPHRVSGATPPTLEFARLVKIANPFVPAEYVDGKVVLALHLADLRDGCGGIDSGEV